MFYAQVKIKELAFNDVYSRTASQILKLAHDYGIPSEEGIIIDFTLSRQELADMVGTTRETISRAISTFKKEKSIFEIQDKIVILNKTGLSRWI